jgi:hypothetical protein
MVKLKDAKDKADRYWYYINANYINVSKIQKEDLIAQHFEDILVIFLTKINRHL